MGFVVLGHALLGGGAQQTHDTHIDVFKTMLRWEVTNGASTPTDTMAGEQGITHLGGHGLLAVAHELLDVGGDRAAGQGDVPNARSYRDRQCELECGVQSGIEKG